MIFAAHFASKDHQNRAYVGKNVPDFSAIQYKG